MVEFYIEGFDKQKFENNDILLKNIYFSDAIPNR